MGTCCVVRPAAQLPAQREAIHVRHHRIDHQERRGCRVAMRHAATPSSASMTANPSSSSVSSISERTTGSSSTIRMSPPVVGCRRVNHGQNGPAGSPQADRFSLGGHIDVSDQGMQAADRGREVILEGSRRAAWRLRCPGCGRAIRSPRNAATAGGPKAPALDFRLCAARHSASASLPAQVSRMVAASEGPHPRSGRPHAPGARGRHCDQGRANPPAQPRR